MLGISPTMARYWTNNFDILKPKTNKKGNRMFTKDDIETLKLIYHLLKERGMTIKGANRKLKENKDETLNNFEIVKRLKDIRQELIEIKEALED